MKKFAIPNLLYIVALIAATACGEPHLVYEQNVEIPGDKWLLSEKAVIDMQITDTITAHNFLINVRNTEAYPYRNLYVFVKTTFPNGKTSRDTVGIILADASGRWLGSGTGFLRSNRYPTNAIMYSYNRRFPITGTYRFEIQHAMRSDTLEGIRSIGLRVEKSHV